MDMLQIAGIGIVGVLLAVQFKSTKPEYGVYLSVAVSIFVFVFTVSKLTVIVDAIETISRYISINAEYITVLLKIIGITFIAEFASAICKDAGNSTIASQIEVFSKLSILAVSMPILLALLETVGGFLQ